MSYRNLLLERFRRIEGQDIEPSVLDYIEFRNRQCLRAWYLRRAEHELAHVAKRRGLANRVCETGKSL